MDVHPRASADVRLLRAAVFSAVCVVLSALGHEMASGAAIPLWALPAAWLGVLCWIAPLAGRERSLPAIVAALLTGELCLHLVFMLGQELASRGGPDAVAGMAVPAMPGMPGTAASAMPGLVARSAHPMSMAAMASPAMLAAHLAAALGSGWVLRRGEAAVWRVLSLPAKAAAELTARLIRALVAIVLLRSLLDRLEQLARAVRLLLSRLPVRRPDTLRLHGAVVRRGPPLRAPAV